MKRTISLLLAVIMVLTGCSQPQTQNPSTDSVADIVSVPTEWIEVQPEFNSLSDENLLLQVENLVYRETVQALNSEEYVVENVSAVYISKEYLDEVAFNSQSNVYFGYTLAELDEVFQGTRYIFTLGDDGNTTVRELQAIDDPQAPPGYIPAPHIPSLSESPSGRFCPDGSRNYCPRPTVHRVVLAAVQLPAG